jgi:hypothetical protein
MDTHHVISRWFMPLAFATAGVTASVPLPAAAAHSTNATGTFTYRQGSSSISIKSPMLGHCYAMQTHQGEGVYVANQTNAKAEVFSDHLCKQSVRQFAPNSYAGVNTASSVLFS